MRQAAHTDGKAVVNLMKLTLFKQYYIVVVCYIYFTRVVVYALITIIKAFSSLFVCCTCKSHIGKGTDC